MRNISVVTEGRGKEENRSVLVPLSSKYPWLEVDFKRSNKDEE